MPWLQLTFAMREEEEANALADLLPETAAVAVTLRDGADQPLFEPLPGETPLWQQTLITALYEEGTVVAEVITQLARLWAPRQLPEHQLQILEDQIWERAWMEGFTPMCFGKRLWIVPSWSAPPQPDAINLHLDPGLAFGTGTHPTTRLCLQWLDSHPPTAQEVVDYGCGSGVLAIAAILLGANHCLCIDNDPQALEATLDNGSRNGLTEQLTTALPETATTTTPVDLLLANILAAPLMELAPHLGARVKVGGRIILSGILEEQWQEVARHYLPHFQLDPPEILDGWVRLSGQRRR
ncbi:MAG: 50S ribosomal protein L11 methyltransferase [Gammaproteobacteria bacterium]|nr:50S ribosomal protein L11 methyltransferase [Gammaproteobacteria bacterium]